MFTKKNIPNFLTISRFFLSILSIACYCLSTKRFNSDPVIFLTISPLALTAIILFCICVITDYFDGYLARKWQVISNFGKVFDPVIDKVMICGFLFAFVLLKQVYWLLPVLLIFRDVIVDVCRIIFYKKNIVIAAIKYAKYKTILQMAGVFIIFFLNSKDMPQYWISTILLIPAVIFSYLSFFQYIYQVKSLFHNS